MIPQLTLLRRPPDNEQYLLSFRSHPLVEQKRPLDPLVRPNPRLALLFQHHSPLARGVNRVSANRAVKDLQLQPSLHWPRLMLHPFLLSLPLLLPVRDRTRHRFLEPMMSHLPLTTDSLISKSRLLFQLSLRIPGIRYGERRGTQRPS